MSSSYRDACIESNFNSVHNILNKRNLLIRCPNHSCVPGLIRFRISSDCFPPPPTILLPPSRWCSRICVVFLPRATPLGVSFLDMEISIRKSSDHVHRFKGKALGAFGISSGNAGNTLFRRELASVRTFFPHDDDDPPTNIPQLYNDLFELFRSVSVPNQARQLLNAGIFSVLSIISIPTREMYYSYC